MDKEMREKLKKALDEAEYRVLVVRCKNGKTISSIYGRVEDLAKMLATALHRDDDFHFLMTQAIKLYLTAEARIKEVQDGEGPILSTN